MRIFVAGASGVIGVRLVPLLLAGGHAVAGMTRSADRASGLAALGAEPVVCDAFDAEMFAAAVAGFAPDLVMHQLTDLPDVAGDLPEFAARNERMRSEGTINLLAAAAGAGARRCMAQSIAWAPARGVETVQEHERRVLAAGGLVIRYGQFYGPGTYFEDDPPSAPRIQIDQAALCTAALLDAAPGVVVIEESADGVPVTRRARASPGLQ